MDPSKWIDVTVDKNHYSLDHFVIPKHYEQDLSSILIPHGVIMDRVQKLARLIVDQNDGPLGGYQYASDLVNCIKKLTTASGHTVPISMEFIRVKSYENDQSVGVNISLTENELKDFEGKNILIVEDIIDTGKTMVALLERLQQYKPKTTKVTSLLVKKTDRSNGYIPHYVGFAIPDAFVVGYALDYNEHFRDLDHICVISNDCGVRAG
ncbi:hypothetical protein [Absidia glauca]|uniref:Phosphoribosyltransferase domain-containing protein n=1 Tax=Absidia glauca TaxID=4829 RepID=A0A163ITU7_ABSGL|nr:hypothetical protein [Absidia glauca]